jgi:hypothetical protein
MLVEAPPRATLGVPFAASARLPASTSLISMSVYQRGEMGRVPLEKVSASAEKTGAVHLRIMPKLLGPVRFDVRAEFADGSVSLRTVQIFVAPPAVAPLAFRANDLPVVVLTLGSDTTNAVPHPSAHYSAPVGNIDLNARFVHWQLVPQDGAPVIRIEPNGLIHALRPGKAHAVAHFGSSTATLGVLVRATQQ